MITRRHPETLLKQLDLDKRQFLALLDLARGIKPAKADGTENPRLVGKNTALIFEKASTRTRCAFEVAAHDQGAHVTYLGPDGSHIGREEGVPVWNGLTDDWHPTQMLADLLTMTEHRDGNLEDIAYCYLGGARNNVARSLLITGGLLGMDVRTAVPRELWPPDDVITTAHALAAESGARMLVTDGVSRAVHGVDFAYTDVWVSMGESIEQWAARVPLLLPYRVTERPSSR